MLKGMNNTDIKRSNRGLVLKNIALNKALYRIELAKATGLTKMTTGNIVQEFISMGLVEEGGSINIATSGPSPQKLVISNKAPKIIGMYLSRDSIVFSVGNLNGEISYKKDIPLIDETEDSIAKKIIEGIKSAEKVAGNNIAAIGASLIGPIDKEGSVVDSPNFFGIKRLPVKAILQENFPYPVVVYNDISAAAVAEQYRGEGLKDFVFVGISNGIGAGIIHKGDLLTANNSYLGELGHISIDIKGEKCPCGNTGCLELYTSVKVLNERLSKELQKNITVRDYEDIKALPGCDKIFTDVANKLSSGLVTVANLLSPGAFVLGYEGYYLPDKYLKVIEDNINSTRFLKDNGRVEVKKAALQENSAIYGSIASVMREIFDGKILFNN